MTSIIITYYNRPDQLNKTLSTIKSDCEIIIVDDASTVPFQSEHKVIRIEPEEKTWKLPGAGKITNMAVREAKGDIIILQNAECYHVGNVVEYAEKNLTDKNYISFSCFSLDEENTFKEHDIFSLLNTKTAQFNGDLGWYNHPVYRPTGYFFCAAMTKENYLKIGGIDERYDDGIAWADEDFVRKVKINFEIEIPETPFVVHQWHYSGKNPYDDKEGFERNKKLFYEND